MRNALVFIAVNLYFLSFSILAFDYEEVVNSGTEPFERLFSTHAERRYLEREKDKPKQASPTPADSSIQQVSNAQGKEGHIQFDGYIVRDDGVTHYWLKSSENLKYQIVTKPRVGGIESVGISVVRRTKKMLPGQIWLLDKNRVIENFQYQEPSHHLTVKPTSEPDIDAHNGLTKRLKQLIEARKNLEKIELEKISP